MQVAAVLHAVRVLLVIPAVELGDLVAAVEHREAAEEGHGLVHEQVAVDAALQRRLVMRVQRLLDAAQAGGGAAAAGVAAGRVVVVQLAHRPAAGDRTLVEVVQELLVAERVDAEPPLLRLVQAPANVVVAAQVVDEPAVLGQGVQRVDLRLEQPGVAVGERAPQVDHRGDVVQHVAFGVLRGAEIGGELLGGHHHLAFEDHGRADAFEGDAQHADDGVHLRQVAAGGAQLLPDVGHGVDAQHLHAQVRQVQRAGQHGHQHLGVAVVEVPLERVEGGQHPLVHLVAPAEVAGRGVREDLRGGPLVFVGDGAVVVAEVVVLVFGVAGLGLHGPFMGGGGVVHHEVEAQADAGLAQLLVREARSALVPRDGSTVLKSSTA